MVGRSGCYLAGNKVAFYNGALVSKTLFARSLRIERPIYRGLIRIDSGSFSERSI